MGFSFDKLKFSITNDCEGRCNFCYRNEQGTEHYLDLTLINKAIKDCSSVGLNKIHISGGNPFLHPNFMEIMDNVFTYNLPVKLSTTATYLSLKVISRFVSKGLTEIALSLNASKPNIHDRIRGIKGDFVKTVNIIKFMQNLGIQIIITFVVTSRNIHHLYDLPCIIPANQNVIIKIQLVEASLLSSKRDTAKYCLNKKQLILLYKDILFRLYDVYRKENVFIAPTVNDQDNETFKLQIEAYEQGIYTDIKDKNAFCDYMLSNPHIKEDGKVYPCCGKDTQRIIGDLRNQGIKEIYKRHYNHFRNIRGLPYYSCRHCIFYTYYN